MHEGGGDAGDRADTPPHQSLGGHGYCPLARRSSPVANGARQPECGAAQPKPATRSAVSLMTYVGRCLVGQPVGQPVRRGRPGTGPCTRPASRRCWPRSTSASSATARVELGERHRAHGQAPRGGIGAAEGPGRVRQVAGPGDADRPDEALAHAPRRPQAPLGVRVAELGLVGDHDEVAAEGELERAGEAEPVDLGDHDLRDRRQPGDHRPGGPVEPLADAALVEAPPGQRLEVDAGAERPSLAGQDDDADLVGGQRSSSAAPSSSSISWVMALSGGRAAERDGGDGAVAGDEHGGFGSAHRPSVGVGRARGRPAHFASALGLRNTRPVSDDPDCRRALPPRIRDRRPSTCSTCSVSTARSPS